MTVEADLAVWGEKGSDLLSAQAPRYGRENRHSQTKEVHKRIQKRSREPGYEARILDCRGCSTARYQSRDARSLEARTGRKGPGRVSWQRETRGELKIAGGATSRPDGAQHLKKGDGLLCQGIPVRYQVIEKHRNEWSVKVLCSTLKVARSGFYEWRGRPKSSRARQDEILSIFQLSYGQLTG